MIKLIWAQTPSGIIGNKGKLPWKIHQEMEHFKKTTLNHDILMGRKTFESMNSKPLLKRFNYILTTQTHYQNGVGYKYIQDFQPLISSYQNSSKHDLYVIGGEEIIKLLWPFADEMIVSIVNQEYEGDKKLSPLDWSGHQLVKVEKSDEFIVQYWTKK